MGVDLRLLPFDADIGSLSFSHTLLSCERYKDLFNAISDTPSLQVPPGFNSFTSREVDEENTQYGPTTTDSYGDPVKYTTASELVKLANHPGVTDNFKNRAIWAYLKCLPPETKVALYWC